MSEYREGMRHLEERIEALKRENADLLAQLTETEAALITRDIEHARAKDEAPRRFLPWMLVPLGAIVGLFTFAYFKLSAPRAPDSDRASVAAKPVDSAASPARPAARAPVRPGYFELHFDAKLADGSKQPRGTPCKLDYVGHSDGGEVVTTVSVKLECGGEPVYVVLPQRPADRARLARVTPTLANGWFHLDYLDASLVTGEGGHRFEVDTANGRGLFIQSSPAGDLRWQLVFQDSAAVGLRDSP